MVIIETADNYYLTESGIYIVHIVFNCYAIVLPLFFT